MKIIFPCVGIAFNNVFYTFQERFKFFRRGVIGYAQRFPYPAEFTPAHVVHRFGREVSVWHGNHRVVKCADLC